MIVVDASVAVKWILPEPFSEEAETLLSAHIVRIAPEHLLVEVGQVLLRAVRAGAIPLDDAREAVASLPQFVQVLPTHRLATHAMEVAVRVGCTNYDALYVAAAERWEAVLVTADRRLERQLNSAKSSARVHLLGGPNRT